jgi:Mrp family chromosome partitioning ATPase
MRHLPRKEQLEWVHAVLGCHFQGIVLDLPPMGELRARELCARLPNAIVLVSHPGCGTWSIKRAVKRLRAADANLVASSLVRS